MVESEAMKIADIFAAPGRFLRSVQLEKDFSDPAALESYIATPPMVEALHRILESTEDGSRRRAWRITGDYGVGKSSLALVLARLLSDPSANDAQRVATAVGWNQDCSGKRFLPILVTGSRESIPTAIARGVRDSIMQQRIPEYTRKAKALSPTTLAVRNALLSAREPASLLFADLPHACGLPSFGIDQADDSSIDDFIGRFTDSVSELQNTYGELIKRIVRATSEAIGQDPKHFDRVALASRAARVSLAAREPRLRAFALRLRDPALHDEAWAESLASFVVAKPPSRWLPGDEVRFTEEIGALAEVFARVESTIFSSSEDRPDVDAIRLNLTRGDGRDLVRVLHPVSLDEGDQESMQALAKRLPQGETQRIQILANLLWEELERVRQLSSEETEAGDTPDLRFTHDH